MNRAPIALVAYRKLSIRLIGGDNIAVTLASSRRQCVGTGYVTYTGCFVTTDLVIENDRLFDVGLPHLPPLTLFPSPSTVIVLHIDLLGNNE